MRKLMMMMAIGATTFFACKQSKVNPEVIDPSIETQSAQNALRVISSSQELDRLGFGSPSIFNQGVGIQSGRNSNGRSSGRSFTTAKASKSTARGADDGDGAADWTTCATEEFTENADGSYTWILDYGEDGCEENGYFMKGKIIENFTENENAFSSTIEYINFGDKEFSINGKSTYEGTFNDTGIEDSTWSGSYSYTDDLTILVEDETYKIEAEGSETFDDKGFTSEKGFTKCTSSTGDFFHTVISTPLYFSFDCDFTSEDNYVFVYVSGVETTSYQETTEDEKSESGEFSIDYGDGTCDNIVIITEDGVSTTVDLGDEWEEDWGDQTEG